VVVVVEVVIDCGGREKLSGLVGGCLNNRAPFVEGGAGYDFA